MHEIILDQNVREPPLANNMRGHVRWQRRDGGLQHAFVRDINGIRCLRSLIHNLALMGRSQVYFTSWGDLVSTPI